MRGALAAALAALLAAGAALLLSRGAAGPQSLQAQLSPTPVEVRDWDPERPFAHWLAARDAPMVLRHTVVDKWRARSWTMKDDSLAGLLGESLERVYRHGENRFFGPYFDESRPFKALPGVHRLNAFAEDVEMPTREFLQAVRDGAPPGGPFLYYSGELDRFPDRVFEEVQPIRELLELEPTRTSVNLWMGQQGVVAPAHFDGYTNFYVQLEGRKRFLLFSPLEAPKLQFFPFLHPSYAQCQVNLSEPASERFPLAAEARAWEAVLEPGDLLYLPPLWFHQVEALTPSLSVNVWTDPPEAGLAAELLQLPLPQTGLEDRREAALVGAASIRAALQAAGFEPEPFVRELFRYRYHDIVRRGEVDGSATAQSAANVCPGEPPARHAPAIAEYAALVGPRAAALPDATRAVWMGNLVEYVSAVSAGVANTAVFVRQLPDCFEFIESG